MVIVTQFAPAHLVAIDLQPSQGQWLGPWTPARDTVLGEALREAGPCWTATADGGRVLICAGLAEQWPGHAVAWAYLASGIGSRMRQTERSLGHGRCHGGAGAARHACAIAQSPIFFDGCSYGAAGASSGQQSWPALISGWAEACVSIGQSAMTMAFATPPEASAITISRESQNRRITPA